MLARVISMPTLIETLAGFGYYPLKELEPIIKISYKRYRFTEVLSGQSMALDCHIQSTAIAPNLCPMNKDIELSGAVIEIKGKSLEITPTLNNLKLLEIDWSRFSKYSGCIEAYQENMGACGYSTPSGLNCGHIPVALGKYTMEDDWNAIFTQPSSSVPNSREIDG
jgi:hypothetical protein